jgi:hypothetical protein
MPSIVQEHWEESKGQIVNGGPWKISSPKYVNI